MWVEKTESDIHFLEIFIMSIFVSNIGMLLSTLQILQKNNYSDLSKIIENVSNSVYLSTMLRNRFNLMKCMVKLNEIQGCSLEQ